MGRDEADPSPAFPFYVLTSDKTNLLVAWSKNSTVVAFSEFSDNVSIVNWAKSGPSIYTVSQIEKKDDSLKLFLSVLTYSAHSHKGLNWAGFH